MSNFKELLFTENDDWMKVTAKIEYFKEQIEKATLLNLPRHRSAYYAHLYRAYNEKEAIEAELLNQYNLRAMATRGSLESTDDDFLVSQIVKHGYLTGFKF